MQRRVEDGIIIACDFCGTDWDQVKPMAEGHHGSVICLDCVDTACRNVTLVIGKFKCVLCLREIEGTDRKCWSPGDRPENANPDAIVCYSCIKQAARAFTKDKDIEWTAPEIHDPGKGSRSGATDDDDDFDDDEE